MADRKKVLLISYIYPPAGGGGSPRLVRWTRAIAQAGWEPIALTVKGVYEKGEDQSLLLEVEPLARIERTGSLDPKRIVFLIQAAFRRKKTVPAEKIPQPNSSATKPSAGWLWRMIQVLRNWLMVPDDLLGWMPFALCRAWRIIRSQKPSLIITSSSPHSVQLIGLVLKKIYGLPWLADFRDNWASHPYYFFPTRLHRRLNARMEKSVLKNADLVTFAYGLKPASEAYPQLQHKFREWRNGFREQDFQNVEPVRLFGFNLLFLGALYGAHGPQNFFSALKRLLQHHPELSSELKVWMIGPFLPFDVSLAQELGLGPVVNFKNFMPHSRIFSWMLAADVLVLILQSDLISSAVVPGKVFEYIRAPKWILGLIPKGETAEILRAAGGAIIVPGNQPDKIEAAILELHQRWKQGQQPARNMSYVMSKEENCLNQQMQNCLASLLGTGPES